MPSFESATRALRSTAGAFFQAVCEIALPAWVEERPVESILELDGFELSFTRVFERFVVAVKRICVSCDYELTGVEQNASGHALSSPHFPDPLRGIGHVRPGLRALCREAV